MTIDIHWNTIGQVLASWDNPFILENMGDSPLSITASVTGILTFVAAILAFIYVRYLTLRNSKDEMNSILISVTASIGETNRVRASIQSAEAKASHGRDNASQPRILEDTLTQLETTIGDLYLVEMKILSSFMETYGLDSGDRLVGILGQGPVDYEGLMYAIKESLDTLHDPRKSRRSLIKW